MTGLPTLVVETLHSLYVIDQNSGKYSRTRVHEDANTLGFGVGNDGEWCDYDKVVSSLEPGERVVIVHPDGSWVHSTAIQSVKEVVTD